MKYILILISATLLSCGNKVTGNGNLTPSDSTSAIADTIVPKDSASMEAEENQLLKTLIPDLYSRKFPTAEEMKMWDLIIEKDVVDRKKMPLLARALMRAYVGKQFWYDDENGNPEAEVENMPEIPALIDFWGTGDIEYYGICPDTIIASSTSHHEGTKYVADDIIKFGVYKPWCSEIGKAVGSTITCKFQLKNRYIKGFIPIVNGFYHTEKQWRNHGRIAKLQLFVNEEPLNVFTLKDDPKTQYLEFDQNIKPTSKDEITTLTFKILEVYPGAKYNDVSISNLYFSDDGPED